MKLKSSYDFYLILATTLVLFCNFPDQHIRHVLF